MKTPNLGDAHCGFGALQSQQLLLLLVFWMARSCAEERDSVSLCAPVNGHPAIACATVWQRCSRPLLMTLSLLSDVPLIEFRDRPPTWPWTPCWALLMAMRRSKGVDGGGGLWIVQMRFGESCQVPWGLEYVSGGSTSLLPISRCTPDYLAQRSGIGLRQ